MSAGDRQQPFATTDPWRHSHGETAATPSPLLQQFLAASPAAPEPWMPAESAGSPPAHTACEVTGTAFGQAQPATQLSAPHFARFQFRSVRCCQWCCQ